MNPAVDIELLPEEVEFGLILNEAEDKEKRRSRQRNFGKVQHRKFTGYDQKLPMVIYGLREETVHGTSADGRPHTLVVFRWGLQQRKRGRRFKSVQLRARFSTARMKDPSLGGGPDTYYDPHVVKVEPNGTYSLLPTPVTVVRTRAFEGGLEGSVDFAKGTSKLTYELSTTVEGTDQIIINGVERNEYDFQTAKDLGDPDRCNIAEWQLFENTTTRSGLPTFFRTAALLERREGDTARFTATFTIRTEVDSMTNAWTKFKRFVGLMPRDDPIIFDPSLDERGRFAVFKDKLDSAPLLDECRLVMFKTELDHNQPTVDTEQDEESTEGDIDSSETEESDWEEGAVDRR